MTKLRAEIEAEKIIGDLNGWGLYTMPGRKFTFLNGGKQLPRIFVITNGKRGKQRWAVEASSWPSALAKLKVLFDSKKEELK